MTKQEFWLYKPKILNDFVVIEWIKQEYSTDIKIPISYYKHSDLAKGKPCLGKILEVGPKVKDLKKGDYCEFNEYAADAGLMLNENRVYFIQERDINFALKSKPKSMFISKK